jgi:hypothetical protein
MILDFPRHKLLDILVTIFLLDKQEITNWRVKYRISAGNPDNICPKCPNELTNIFLPLHPEGHIQFPKLKV